MSGSMMHDDKHYDRLGIMKGEETNSSWQIGKAIDHKRFPNKMVHDSLSRER